MKKHLFVLLPVVLILCLASYSHTQTPSEPVASPAAGDFSDLTLEINVNKRPFLLLEPIPISLTLKNNTQQPIYSHTALEFSSNHVKLFVSNNYGTMKKIENLSSLSTLVVVKPHNIEPGQTFAVNELLNLALEKVFPNTGFYQLQAVFDNVDGTKEIKSNTVTIHVLEPEGLNKQAFEFIKSNGTTAGTTATFFNGVGLSRSEAAQNKLKQFVSLFGESVYGDYTAFQLGEYYFYKGDYEKAKENFEPLTKKPDFAFADKAAHYKAKIKEKLEKDQ